MELTGDEKIKAIKDNIDLDDLGPITDLGFEVDDLEEDGHSANLDDQ